MNRAILTVLLSASMMLSSQPVFAGTTATSDTVTDQTETVQETETTVSESTEQGESTSAVSEDVTQSDAAEDTATEDGDQSDETETTAADSVETLSETGLGDSTSESEESSSSSSASETDSSSLETVSASSIETDDSTETVEEEQTETSVVLQAYVQGSGWDDAQEAAAGSDTVTLGSAGSGSALTAFRMNTSGDENLGIQYSTYVQDDWQDQLTGADAVENDPVSGTTENGQVAEAIQIQLTGDDAANYHLYYRVYVQSIGWMGWTEDGGYAGAAGAGLRIETVEVALTDKNASAPSSDELDTSASYFSTQVTYQAHVQNKDWMDKVTNGAEAGTHGQFLQMEALRVWTDPDAGDAMGVSYQAHVQNKGWMSAVSSGKTAGTTGKGLRMEALKISLTGEDSKFFDIFYRVHVENIGWLGWAKDGETAGTTDMARRAEAVEIVILPKGQTPSQSGSATSRSYLTTGDIVYQAHVQSEGWMSTVKNGAIAGTTGKGLRMEAIRISTNAPGLGVQYRSHIENRGWESSWHSSGDSGTTGKGLRLEAIQIKLTGDASKYFDIFYRVHVENIGWLGWAKNGETAGTTGMALRVEAIQIVILPDGDTPSKSGSATSHSCLSTSDIIYKAHVQSVGWQNAVKNGASAGTEGKNLRMEAIQISTNAPGLGVQYLTHIENTGWESSWHSSGTSGTTGKGLRLEAIKIKLTGDASKYFNIYYRAHVENFGWLGWAKNGESAGSEGYGYRMEALQIVIRAKNQGAPGSTSDAFKKYRPVITTDVPLIMQNPELPTGCESVALTMVLNSLGYNLSKTTIADYYLPRNGANFAVSYYGNPHSVHGAGCFAPCITNTANTFLIQHGSSKRAHDVTGTSLSDLTKYIDQGIPVIVWSSVHLRAVNFTGWTCTWNGRTYRWYSSEHCVVMYGYNAKHTSVYISDSIDGKVVRNWSAFESIYNTAGMNAVVIY
jgi:uncharacterized protein YjdB